MRSDNRQVTFDDAGWRLKTDPAEQPDPAQSERLAELHRWLDARSRTIRLADLLIEVENDLGFSVQFQQPGEKQVDPGEVCALLAAILAHGCNLGLYTMEKVAPDIAYRRLKYVSDWRLVEENQRAALAAIVHGISRLDAAGHWGDGTTSASDGQRFAMPHKVLQRTCSTRFNDFALEFYSFVADNYAPFYSRPIECTDRDAPFVLDGVLYHESDLDLEEHYTDTHGYTEINFAAFGMILACIVYWQAREISRLAAAPDFPFDPDLLRHVSPIEWKNVVLYGEIKIDPAKLTRRGPKAVSRYRIANCIDDERPLARVGRSAGPGLSGASSWRCASISRTRPGGVRVYQLTGRRSRRSSQWTGRLPFAQRRERVGRRGAPCRHQARKQRHPRQQQARDAQHGGGVARSDVEEKTGGKPRGRDRRDRAERQSERREHDALSERQPDDGGGGGAEGGANPELLLPLHHRMRHDAVESYGGEKQAEHPERADDRGAAAREGQHPQRAHHGVHAAGLQYRQGRLVPADRVGDHRDQGARRSVHVHVQRGRPHQPGPERIEDERRLLERRPRHVRVTHDSDHLVRRTARRGVDDPSSDCLLSRPELPSRALADDHHPPVARSVCLTETPSPEHRDTHGVEEAGVDVVPGDPRRVGLRRGAAVPGEHPAPDSARPHRCSARPARRPDAGQGADLGCDPSAK